MAACVVPKWVTNNRNGTIIWLFVLIIFGQDSSIGMVWKQVVVGSIQQWTDIFKTQYYHRKYSLWRLREGKATNIYVDTQKRERKQSDWHTRSSSHLDRGSSSLRIFVESITGQSERESEGTPHINNFTSSISFSSGNVRPKTNS